MISHRERMVSLAGASGIPFLIGLLLLSSFASQRWHPPERKLAVFDVAAPNSSSTPKPRPKVVPKVEPVPVVVSKDPAVVSVPPEVALLLAEASEQAGACDLTAPVQAALRVDPGVIDVVAHLPREARSVANAIMVWNDVWFPSDGTEAAALPAIQDTIVATVAAATLDCRMAHQEGPRFLTMADNDATVVALGSEEWRWQDLVDTATTKTAVATTFPDDSHASVSATTSIALRK